MRPKIKMPPNVSEAATGEVLKAKRPDDCRGAVFYKRECIPTSTFLSREIFNYFHFSLNWFLFSSIVAAHHRECNRHPCSSGPLFGPEAFFFQPWTHMQAM